MYLVGKIDVENILFSGRSCPICSSTETLRRQRRKRRRGGLKFFKHTSVHISWEVRSPMFFTLESMC